MGPAPDPNPNEKWDPNTNQNIIIVDPLHWLQKNQISYLVLFLTGMAGKLTFGTVKETEYLPISGSLIRRSRRRPRVRTWWARAARSRQTWARAAPGPPPVLSTTQPRLNHRRSKCRPSPPFSQLFNSRLGLLREKISLGKKRNITHILFSVEFKKGWNFNIFKY